MTPITAYRFSVEKPSPYKNGFSTLPQLIPILANSEGVYLSVQTHNNTTGEVHKVDVPIRFWKQLPDLSVIQTEVRILEFVSDTHGGAAFGSGSSRTDIVAMCDVGGRIQKIDPAYLYIPQNP